MNQPHEGGEGKERGRARLGQGRASREAFPGEAQQTPGCPADPTRRSDSGMEAGPPRTGCGPPDCLLLSLPEAMPCMYFRSEPILGNVMRTYFLPVHGPPLPRWWRLPFPSKSVSFDVVPFVYLSLCCPYFWGHVYESLSRCRSRSFPPASSISSAVSGLTVKSRAHCELIW